MDLDRPEVSDTSESSLHCTICSTCHSCPVEPALCPLPSLSCMLLCCNHPPLSTSVQNICMYLVLRMVGTAHGGHPMPGFLPIPILFTDQLSC